MQKVPLLHIFLILKIEGMNETEVSEFLIEVVYK